tara:strand:+ start:1513 stop:1686 length:174 start_codon:yes stop_codon:yes gene_type:complete
MPSLTELLLLTAEHRSPHAEGGGAGDGAIGGAIGGGDAKSKAVGAWHAVVWYWRQLQ